MGTADFLLGNLDGPLDPTSQEAKDYLAGQRTQAVALSSLLPGLASLALPPVTKDGSFGWKQMVPGVIPQAYNFLSGLKHLSSMAMVPLTGDKATGLPGSNITEEMAQGSLDTANRLIPHMQPTEGSSQDKVAMEAGNAFGQMAPFGAAKGLIEGLPAAARLAIGVAAPGLESKAAAPIVGAITTGAGAYQEHSAEPIQTPTQDTSDTWDIQPLPSAGATQPVSIVPPAPPTKANAYDPLPPNDPYAPLPEAPVKPGLQGDQDLGITLGKVAMYGVAAIAVIKGGPRAVRFVDELVGGLRDSIYGDNALRYNNAETAIKQGVADAPHVEAPLPVGVGGPIDAAKVAVVNRSARIQSYTDAISANKTAAEQLRAETGLVNNSSAFNGRVADIAQTGLDKTSGIKMPAIVDHWDRVAKFTETQTDLYNKARFYADELDNRAKLFNAARKAGSTQPGALNDANFRVNFPFTDSADLRAAVAAAQADPVVAAELDTINRIHARLMSVAQSRDFISAAEARKLTADHPNYLASTNTDGSVTGSFGTRDVNPGGGLDSIPIHASEVDKQHFTDLFRSIENNAWVRHIVDVSAAYQDANPRVAQIFLPNRTANGGWAKVTSKGDSISFRRDGVTENWKVGNTPLLRDMTGGSQHMGPIMGALNYMRNILQSAVTGPIAALSGHFFPPVNAMRNTLLASAFRPAGSTYGPITGLISKVTGGAINPRGLLPDAMLGTGMGMLQGLGAEGARALAHIFDPTSSNAAWRLLRSSMGRSWSAAIQQRMEAAWDTSIRAEMKANGTLGSAGYASLELPAKQIAARESVSSPLNDLVPELFRADGVMGGVMPKYVRLKNLYHEMQSIVNESVQTHFYSTNKGKLPPDKLAYETRQLTGDPSTHGASKAVRAATQAIPYSNITIQGLARIARSFAETPISTAYGVLSTMGTLALGSIYTAKLKGYDAINHLTNEISNDQRASRVYFYVPFVSPESSPYIDLPQELRVFYPIMLQAAHNALNLQADQHAPDSAAQTMEWLHDLFNRHVTSSTGASSLAGLSDATSFSPPPAVSAGANLLGSNVAPNLYNQTMPGESAIIPIGGDIRAPGHTPGADPLTGSVSMQRISHAVSSMLGIAGTSVMSALNSIKAGNKAHNDPMQTIGVLGDQWLDRLKDSVPFMRGTVFANNSTLASKSPLIERTEAALGAMRPTVSWKSEAKYGATDASNGYTRAKGQELETRPLNDNNMPKDPTMARVYDSYGAYTSFIERKMMPPISDLRKQINALSGSTKPPDEIRAQRNTYQRQLQQKYEKLAGVINDADAAASRIIGKNVSILHMDFKKGPEQFNDQAQ